MALVRAGIGFGHEGEGGRAAPIGGCPVTPLIALLGPLRLKGNHHGPQKGADVDPIISASPIENASPFRAQGRPNPRPKEDATRASHDGLRLVGLRGLRGVGMAKVMLQHVYRDFGNKARRNPNVYKCLGASCTLEGCRCSYCRVYAGAAPLDQNPISGLGQSI